MLKSINIPKFKLETVKYENNVKIIKLPWVKLNPTQVLNLGNESRLHSSLAMYLFGKQKEKKIIPTSKATLLLNLKKLKSRQKQTQCIIFSCQIVRKTSN